jgi:hypothetical protein
MGFDPTDREILDRPLGLDTPQGLVGDFQFADGIMLDPKAHDGLLQKIMVHPSRDFPGSA